MTSLLRAAACVLFALTLIGCMDQGNEPPTDTTASKSRPPSPWQSRPGSESVVAIPMEPDDPDMQAAIAEARRTAEDARIRWTDCNAHDRLKWAIKWAAPTADNKIEHLWVIPVNWSPFRIEGVLQSTPVAELASGKTEGQIVSFPIEELTDWVHVLTVDPATNQMTTEGGFTDKVLEARYGKP